MMISKSTCTDESKIYWTPNTLIWYINGEAELSATAKRAIEADNTINIVSIVSLWEMAIKISLGKLELKILFNQIVISKGNFFNRSENSSFQVRLTL